MCACSVMFNSSWPHGLKPSRLLCPWHFPGKNTGVGCHFLLQGIFPTQGSNPLSLASSALAGGFFTTALPGEPIQNKEFFKNAIAQCKKCNNHKGSTWFLLRVQLCSLNRYVQVPDSSVHGDSPGKNTGVGCHVLLQGVFPTQGSNPVSHIAANSLPSEPLGKPPNLWNVTLFGNRIMKI